MDSNYVELDDNVLSQILKTETDLRDYSQQIESTLKSQENLAIDKYIKAGDQIVTLHKNLKECENILENTESVLFTFQEELKNITNEITRIQQRSISMAQQLCNRQSVKGLLRQFIDDIVIPESLIVAITTCTVVDENFSSNLSLLNYKILFIDEQNFKDVKSLNDVKGVIENLKIVALTKIRQFILEQINKFKKPTTNYHIPQNTLFEYKFLFEFLLNHDSISSREILNEYIDAVSKVYYTYFKSYLSYLQKFQFEEAATKDDLLAAEDPTTRSLFQKSMKKNTVFTIGNRANVLNEIDSAIIIPHQNNLTNLSFEALFRSVQYALVDNACREYKFDCEFFKIDEPQAQSLFSQIMGKTLGLLIKNLENFVENCYDALALFLCGQLSMRYQTICQKRLVPVLTQYWDTLLAMIGMRFQFIMKRHVQSVKDYDISKFNKETKPHFVMRRYAELVSVIISYSDNNRCEHELLCNLTEEVLGLVLRIATMFSTRKDRLIFLINNYDLVLRILMERIRDNTFEVDRFKEELSARSKDYVDEVLHVYFGGMMEFVNDAENGRNIDSDSRQLGLAKTFASTWKMSLEEINKEILPSFPNLTTGASLLQLAFSQFIDYYHKFQKALLAPNKAQLPNIHVIMIELKKYKTNY
ncbi:vacuolar protein sorting-associated protein 52 homolog [Daktulosphaira vitifoliae]|uniref:vacuolar protein sorting-associated protein 52 homolog n=1 Tax=Daktulosphaira vitifoliae TaxID=58002 RepID=UPI0021A9E7CF|nr:vacuolar protein sorting-associated protein 52 homolog [Daktulosphaira vitifoliae]